MAKDKLTRRSFLEHSAVTAAGIGLGSSVLAGIGRDTSINPKKTSSGRLALAPITGRAALVPLDFGTRYEHSVVFITHE
jgi:hypothetical protein